MLIKSCLRFSAFVLTTLVIFSCERKKDISKLEWQSLTDEVSVSLEKKGDGLISDTDNVPLEFVCVTNAAGKTIEQEAKDGKLNEQHMLETFESGIRSEMTGQPFKHASGYARFDIMLPVDVPGLTIYLQPGVQKTTIDSLLLFLRSLKEVTDAVFTSKEEALKAYTKEHDTAWKKILTDNPLPESIDVSFRMTDDIEKRKEQLKADLIKKYPFISEIVLLPGSIPVKTNNSNGRYLVFRFKG